MAAPQIPSPIISGGRGSPQNPMVQILMGLVGQAGRQLLFNALQPEQEPSLQERELETAKDFAFTQNLQTPGSPTQRQAVASGVGDARIPTSKVAPVLEERRAQSLMESDQLQQQAQQDRVAQAMASAQERLRQVGGEQGPLLANILAISADAQTAGMDTSIIKDLIGPMLPPTAKEELDMQQTRLAIAGTENQTEADTFATQQLQRMGIVPEGTDLIPGAGQTLLRVHEIREQKKPQPTDWLQEGLDYVTSRVGQGSVDQFAQLFSAQAGVPAPPGSEPVGVDDAVGEWRAIVQQMAPEGQREQILQRLDSGVWQRQLTIGLATEEIARILQENPAAEADAREALESEFSSDVAASIISKAKQRLSRPRR